MPITVKTPVYEGPLDLLLDLIEKRKLLINDISLAAVADEYIARVNSMEAMPVGETAQFVALAATLLLIKSRSLLPNLEISEGEERDIKELEYRLAVYQIIKDAGRGLRASLGNPMLHEGNTPDPEPMFLPDASVTQESLRAAAQALIMGFPQLAALPKVEVKKIMSLEEMIESLSKRVTSAMKLSFREFTGKRERGEIIVSFLAMLELVKQGIIKANQEKEFGDITLESDAISTPTYE
ncbi:MAG TPA: segregation/condensation protein A [Candidatus Paceibacterota bacterium]|nr:segregation/condensation protein A [Candidatus Paceibacterota bacterium]